MTREEFEILDHTIHRAANRMFCGNSITLSKLVASGYMKCLGQPSWALDPYFTITEKGEHAYENYKHEMVKI